MDAWQAGEPGRRVGTVGAWAAAGAFAQNISRRRFGAETFAAFASSCTYMPYKRKRTIEERENRMIARTNWMASAGIPGTLLAATAVLAVTPAALPAQDDCKFTDVIELDGPAVETLRVNAGAGTLSLTGVEGASEIRVAAKLCASDESRLEGLGVTLRGDRLDTTYPSNRGGIFSFGGNRYARINLAVEMPMTTNLRVDDGSGITYIDGAGDVDLEDSSGNIFISNVGALTVDDGSGDLNISRASGDVRLEDSSGNLTVRNVDGDLVIDDSSGEVTVEDVTGDVTVSDGSGDIRVRAVGGSVHLDEIGSGTVTVRDVEGDLIVAEGRRERIRYSDVRGKVELPPSRRGGSG